MLEQFISVYHLIINFCLKIIKEVNIEQSIEEISGLLAIILLLIITRRIRNRRKIIKTESHPAGKEQAAERTTDDETIADLLPDGVSEDAIEKEIDSPPIQEQDKITDDAVEPVSVDTPPDLGTAPAPVLQEKSAVEKPPEISTTDQIEEPVGFIGRLKSGLSKTRQSLSKRFETILSGNRKIDDDVLEEIEEALITSDIGVSTTMELIGRISKKADTISTIDDFKKNLKKEMLSLVDRNYGEIEYSRPYVIMVVGVNGVGKTTTIGKLASKFTEEGKTVLLAAADTFRAAAVEQLQIWADRAGTDIVKHRDKSDPAAVAFDSIEAALSRDIDVVIVDTAGRLHTKVNLMEQLKKIKRSIGKKLPAAPHETLLVLDATTGQNAVSQAKLFNEDIQITGIALTKLDGTAKGGIVLSISNTLNVPIRYIGIGEGIEDLQEFDPRLFVDALL